MRKRFAAICPVGLGRHTAANRITNTSAHCSHSQSCGGEIVIYNHLGFAISRNRRIFASGIGQERGDDSAKVRMTQAGGFGDQVVQKREQVA